MDLGTTEKHNYLPCICLKVFLITKNLKWDLPYFLDLASSLTLFRPSCHLPKFCTMANPGVKKKKRLASMHLNKTGSTDIIVLANSNSGYTTDSKTSPTSADHRTKLISHVLELCSVTNRGMALFGITFLSNSDTYFWNM